MKYVDMLAGVLNNARGVPTAEAARAMRNACIEFCKETHALTTSVQIATTSAGIASIDTSVMWIVDVVDARIAGVPIDVVPMNDERVRDATADAPVLVFSDPTLMTLVPPPATSVTLDLLASVAPGSSSAEAPDILWQRNAEALEHGALKRLLAQPGKPWSDAKLAAFHGGEFQAAITRQAAINGKNRLTRAHRLRVTPA